MWRRLGFGDATITNEPTIDYNKTSSSFTRTPSKRRTSSQAQDSRLLDDLSSTPNRHRDQWDSDDEEEFNRYRFDYTRNLNFDTFDLDDDLRRDTEMIRKWTRESSLRNKSLRTDAIDDTHYSLPQRFPGKYQTNDVVNELKDAVSGSQIDREIQKLKKELQDQQDEEDLMPGASIVPHLTELTITVQNQTEYLTRLKQHVELLDEQDTTEAKYQTLKEEYLKELVKMEKLYTCYYNLLEKYLEKNKKS